MPCVLPSQAAHADQADAAWADCVSVYGPGGVNLGNDNPDAVIDGCTQSLTLLLPHLGNEEAKGRALLALSIRGDAYLSTGRMDLATADYNKVLTIVGKNAESVAYLRVAVTSYLGGKPSVALSEIEAATRIDPAEPYAALWADIIGRRNNRPSVLSNAAAKMDAQEWPAPVVRLFLGETTFAAVLSAANVADPDIARSQICDANFYAGELALRQPAKDEAIRLLRLAATTCPGGIPEKGIAAAELKALGAAS